MQKLKKKKGKGNKRKEMLTLMLMLMLMHSIMHVNQSIKSYQKQRTDNSQGKEKSREWK